MGVVMSGKIPLRGGCILLTGLVCLVLASGSAFAEPTNDELVGDLNGDCFVDDDDIATFLSLWRYRRSENLDLNDDGRVDLLDANILYSQYQQHCTQLFSVVRLEKDGLELRSASALNNRNQVVGQDAQQIVRFDYRSDGSSILEMGLPDGHGSCEVADINIEGQVIGTALGGTGGFESLAFSIETDGSTHIAQLPETYSTGLSINSFGIGAGYIHLGRPPIQSPSNERAALFFGEQVFDLSGLVDGNNHRAAAINDRFQLVGDTSLEGLGNRAFSLNLIRWYGQEPFTIHTYGESRTFATGINRQGRVIGYALDGGREQGLLWLSDAATIELDGIESGYRTIPLAVNSFNDVSGKASVDRRSPWDAMVWTRDTPIRLNDVIPSSPEVEILEALDINDNGLILARATIIEPFRNIVRPVLLVPNKQWRKPHRFDSRDPLGRLKRLITMLRIRYRPQRKPDYRPPYRFSYN